MTTTLRPIFVAGALLAVLTACSEGEKKSSDSIGPARPEAGCQPIKTEDFETPASGSHHVPEGTPLTYASPPAAALHHDPFPTGSALKNFYAAEDRPPVPDIVHLTEHGYNILWYDETIADDEDAMDDLKSIVDANPIDTYFVAAPWTSEDGPAFPDGAHVALTHWTGPTEMQGIWEYCEAVSGEVVDEFTAEYTKSNSPEPEAP